MSHDELITNFLDQHRKPYSVEQLSDLTGIPLTSATKIHKAHLTRGATRLISPGIYISSSAHQLSRSNQVSGDWNYFQGFALRILDLLQVPHSSARKIGKMLNRSGQYVCKYLTALASIGAIEVIKEGYRAVPGASLERLGCDIEPGILMRLKVEGYNRKWRSD